MKTRKFIHDTVKQNDKLFDFIIEIKIINENSTDSNIIRRTIRRSTNPESNISNIITIEFVNTIDYSFTQYPVAIFDINGEKIYIRISLQVLNDLSGIIRYSILSY
jgi:hypothetical protein